MSFHRLVKQLGHAFTSATMMGALNKGLSDAAQDGAKPDDLPAAGAAPTTPDNDPASQAAIAEAARKERELQLKALGRASTILTGGMGDTTAAPVARRVLGA